MLCLLSPAGIELCEMRNDWSDGVLFLKAMNVTLTLAYWTDLLGLGQAQDNIDDMKII